jgi:hypothetical protein
VHFRAFLAPVTVFLHGAKSWQLRRTLAVGDRPLARAPGGGHQGVQGLAPGGVPLVLRDGCKADPTARRTPAGPWGQPARRQATGAAPQPRWRPRPGLLSGQVVQTVRRRRRGLVTPRVGCGPRERVQPGLAACAWPSHPACVERLTRPSRQPGAAGGRRVIPLCPHEAGLRQQLRVSPVSSPVGFPHASVRPPLPQPLPPHGTGSATCWPAQPPAMAAGLTAPVWTRREVLRLRVPPGPHPAQGCTSRGGGEAAREASLRWRRVSVWPASRPSPGLKGPLGGHASPLLEAFVPSVTVDG